MTAAALSGPLQHAPEPPAPATRPSFLRYLGPGLLVSVGYMDPGNWATDLAAGSSYGYSLLWVVVASSLAAMFLQHLAVKLGLVTGMDLAQASRARYGRRTSIALWLFAEIQIIACDVAEVLGAAIALQLLFGLPLLHGVILTILDVLVLLALDRGGARPLQALVAVLLGTVAVGLGYDWIVARPDVHAMVRGLVPDKAILHDSRMLWLAAGVVGATVMPHNLYLHSASGRERAGDARDTGRAIRLATWDSSLSLAVAMTMNVALLCISAAAFHGTEHAGLEDLRDAHRLLGPALGAPLAAGLFAVALLAAGQSAAITGTMAGRVIMEGYIDVSLPPWARRLLTRSLAVVPTGIVIAIAGEGSVGWLLVLSQVILTLQLPLALVPLVQATSDRRLMGKYANGPWVRRAAWAVASTIVALGSSVLAVSLA